MFSMNTEQFLSGLIREEKAFVDQFRVRVERIMNVAMRRLLARTPVNTGRAVMNYVATSGKPYGGAVIAGFAPVEATNKLPLGAEQLRGQAEAVALATLAQVDYSNPFQEFYISNRAPHIAGLEDGEYPAAPYVPRSPEGMFRVTLQRIADMLQSGEL